MNNLRLAPSSIFANRFEVAELVRSGGMGTVYRAYDRHSGQTVGLKLLRDANGRPDVSLRFDREAQILSELHHPNIVTYITHGKTSEGQQFLAMEWLDGEDLSTRLLHGPLSLRDCLSVLKQLANALSAAHAKNIIHRDLKPENVFLVGGRIARIKLLDFGIAFRAVSARAITRTGVVLGTPEYMAPEQARGTHELTPAADLFSLGCVFYECLAGRPPFVAEHSVAVLARILFEAPAPIADRRPGIPGSVSALLHRLLEKDPRERLADAGQLLSELGSLEEVPEQVPAVTLDGSNPLPETFAESEQHLLSVVLASPPMETAQQNDSAAGASRMFGTGEREELLQALYAMGASADFLVTGALLATVSSTGSAMDQTIRAARAAQLVKDRWPAATVSVATGCGSVHGRTADGDVVELAARAVRGERSLTAADGNTEIWLDQLTAKLLEGRFAQKAQSGGILLLGEETGGDDTPKLLGKPTAFVGRDAEMQSLEAQLKVCIEESSARMVLVTGAPGVGKSRLRHEFLRQATKRQDAITILLGSGELMTAEAPYGILRRAIHRLCGIHHGEPLGVKRGRLYSRLQKHFPQADLERVALFTAELCHLPFSSDDNPLLQTAHHDPKIMRDQIHRALLDWLAAECAEAPVLILLDDLQWGDEVSMSILDAALRELTELPLFVIGIGRPEMYKRFPMLGHGHRTFQIHLTGLRRKACEYLVHQSLGTNVPAELIAHVIEQSGGNALFLEELVRQAAVGRSNEPPETLLAMFQARVGGLDAGARRAIRAAAVFGATFCRGGLLALLGQSMQTKAVDAGIDILLKEELCEKRTERHFIGTDEYKFRHALIREAVYQLLGDEERKLGHRLALDHLQQAGERDPMILAEHARRGGELERAVPLFVCAAEQAYERYDLKNALSCVNQGIAAGAKGDGLGVLSAIQFTAAMWGGEISKTTLSVGLEAVELLQKGGRWWCVCMGYLFVLCVNQGEQGRFSSLTQRFATAEPCPDARGHYVGAASWLVAMFGFVGLREPACQFWELTQKVAAPIMEKESEANTRGLALQGYAWYLRNLERVPYQAMLVAKEAAQAFENAGNLRDLITIRSGLAVTLSELGDPEAGIKLLRETLALRLCKEEATLRWNAEAYLAVILVRQEEEPYLEDACALARNVMDGNMGPAYTGLSRLVLAHAALLRAQLDTAEVEVRLAAELMRPMRVYQLDAQGLLIRVLLQSGRTKEAHALAEEVATNDTLLAGVGYGEVPLWVAIAEARYAHGDLTGAHQALRTACEQLQLRAERISDPMFRERFLTNVPMNARALTLARAWGILLHTV